MSDTSKEADSLVETGDLPYRFEAFFLKRLLMIFRWCGFLVVWILVGFGGFFFNLKFLNMSV